MICCVRISPVLQEHDCNLSVLKEKGVGEEDVDFTYLNPPSKNTSSSGKYTYLLLVFGGCIMQGCAAILVDSIDMSTLSNEGFHNLITAC